MGELGYLYLHMAGTSGEGAGSLQVTLTQPPLPPPLNPSGCVWRCLENGAPHGVIIIKPSFARHQLASRLRLGTSVLPTVNSEYSWIPIEQW